MPEFVYTLQDLRKVVGTDRVILDDITLAFLPGAKIGVLGANGAGKSSLLRIMAGLDSEFLGEARPADGIRIGYLPQEPTLNPDKNVLGNVEEGLAEVRELLVAFDKLNEKFADPMSDDEMRISESVFAELETVEKWILRKSNDAWTRGYLVGRKAMLEARLEELART